MTAREKAGGERTLQMAASPESRARCSGRYRSAAASSSMAAAARPGSSADITDVLWASLR